VCGDEVAHDFGARGQAEMNLDERAYARLFHFRYDDRSRQTVCVLRQKITQTRDFQVSVGAFKAEKNDTVRWSL
jgi:hypothetical protein